MRFGRTTIYKYFKNKDEIFHFALEEIFLRVEGSVAEVLGNAGLGAAQKLTSLLEVFVRASMEDKERMTLIMGLILGRDAGAVETATRKRVMSLRGSFERILLEGIKSGELKEVKPEPMAFALFSLVEAYVIQSSLFSHFSYDEAMEATHILLQGLTKA